MIRLPEEVFAEVAQDRCLQLADEVVEYIANSPATPRGETGRLHLSYYAEETPDGGVVIRSDARYWLYVEYGTSVMAAQPHVRTAIEAVRARHT